MLTLLRFSEAAQKNILVQLLAFALQNAAGKAQSCYNGCPSFESLKVWMWDSTVVVYIGLILSFPFVAHVCLKQLMWLSCHLPALCTTPPTISWPPGNGRLPPHCWSDRAHSQQRRKFIIFTQGSKYYYSDKYNQKSVQNCIFHWEGGGKTSKIPTNMIFLRYPSPQYLSATIWSMYVYEDLYICFWAYKNLPNLWSFACFNTFKWNQ